MSVRNLPRICALLALVTPSGGRLLAQGSLTPPPGVPAPTMKTLDQIEPRRPLVAGTPGVTVSVGSFLITEPGSYYLTADHVYGAGGSAVEIRASGVTLDLMGHAIKKTDGVGLYGIRIDEDGVGDVVIKNGHVLSQTAWNGASFATGGFQLGIYSSTGTANVTVRNITVSGIRTGGLSINGSGSLVENCTVTTVAGNGIFNDKGIVRNCVVERTAGFGIWAGSAIDCQATACGDDAIRGKVVSNCRGECDGAGDGIDGEEVSGSYGVTAGAAGITAVTVTDSVGITNGDDGLPSTGISATVVTNSRGEATHASGGRGISASRSVAGSSGRSLARQGILCSDGTVSASTGESLGSHTEARGIQAQVVTGSYGTSTAANGAEGVRADTLATDCSGVSAGSSGIYGARSVGNCYGYSSATTTGSHGITSLGTVSGSYGWSNGSGGGDGIAAPVVTGSYGFAAAGARHGIAATLAETSFGERATTVSGKFGLQASRASLCNAVRGENVTNKYNMP